MPTIPRKKIKTMKQMEDLDLNKLPNKPSWLDRDSSELDDDEAILDDDDEIIDRERVDIMRRKLEGE